MPPPPRNILIIKPSAIGDVVHTLPILNLLRRAYPRPDTRISWLVTPACAGLLEDHPQLDDLILFDRRRLASWWRSPRQLGNFISLHRSLSAKNFDLVLDLQGLFRSGWLTFATRASRRVGLASAREGAGWFYTQSTSNRSLERHAIERYLDVTQLLGLGRGPVQFVFNTRQQDRLRVTELLAPLRERPFAVLLPGTNWETKKWPARHFAELANTLRDQHGLAVVVAGGSGDQALAEVIRPDLSLCGKTTLRETTALLESASLVVANDTGPMHIAAALGRPLLTLYGPTSPLRTGPYARPDSVLRLNLPCSPCLSRACSHTSCMRLLPPATVALSINSKAGC